MKKNLSRVIIAAPSSGSGKTIFTCGLLNLLKDRVAAFKCGPDYIDPMFHRNVIGVPSENLDSFFLDDDGIKRILLAGDREMAIIEGVMGIYDGIGTSEKGSCYDVAAITNTPIILVVNCQGIWTTLPSIIKGIVSDDRLGLIKGIIFNKTSKYYFDAIAPLTEEALRGIGSSAKVLGFIPSSEAMSLESRHLGLKMPGEIHNLSRQVEEVSALIKENCNLDEIIGIMESAEPIECCDEENYDGENHDKGKCDEDSLRLAVARDRAFCFYYENNLRMMKDEGIEIVEFSPLDDKVLPGDIHGILLGGGYPELYADVLGKNESMRESIKNAIQSGIPSLAECGGFMYLMSLMDNGEGQFDMCQVIPGTSKNTGKLSRFGYIILSGKKEGLLGEDSIKAHEFHYYDSDNNGNDCLAEKASGKGSWECCHMDLNHLWGYPHLYYGSNPGFVKRFKDAMTKYRKNQSNG